MGANPIADDRRDQWLGGQGLRVLRIDAVEVLENLERAVAGIVAECERESPLHHALHGSPPHDFIAGRN
jgi:very-short-patch-repair endonuclease